MNDIVVIELRGEVVPWARPRAVRRGVGQKPLFFTSAKARNYGSDLRLAAQQAMKGRPLLNGPLLMRVTASLPVPESWSKKKKVQAATGIVQPTVKPDWDNLGKIVSDSLQLVVFADDKQIVEAIVRKEYSDRPRLQIIVAPWSHWTTRKAAA